jgi:hypothetical protein
MGVAMSFIDNSGYRSFPLGGGGATGATGGQGQSRPRGGRRPGRSRSAGHTEEVGGGSDGRSTSLTMRERSIKNIGKNLHHITK